ncbi:aspartyl protease family protein [uncultured Olleya sp.]|uniref:aspartyl protease family protein n=1 Tax=uncultured Olleya sp. TaxID=757243 RepID=UPI00259693EF|nr:aspartyl protease family protein [uncultured Olleya sp.]
MNRIFLLFSFAAFSQSQYRLVEGVKSDKIRFQLVSNVIVIPVNVNGIELKFLLDTGVNKPIIFNFLKDSDSLKILNAKKIKLKGLGDSEYVEAIRSGHNTFTIGNAINKDQAFFTIYDSNLNFGPKLGLPIDGIIGYDLFKDFIVEVNYSSQYIRLFDPFKYKYKRCAKCDVVNMSLFRNKPYIQGKVEQDSKELPVKLLIDSGSSDALWLFENREKGLRINASFFNDFLGAGLSGSVYGKRSKIKKFSIGKFYFDNPKVAYPDSVIVKTLTSRHDRDGSIGGEVLKRFNCIIDYQNAKITLKKNSLYKLPFSYNKSGLQVENDGVRLVKEIDVNSSGGSISVIDDNTVKVKAVVGPNKYVIKPSYAIKIIREGSPGDLAGLKVNDVIIYINGRSTHDMTLKELVSCFYKKAGTKLEIKVLRYGFERVFNFELKSPIE